MKNSHMSTHVSSKVTKLSTKESTNAYRLCYQYFYFVVFLYEVKGTKTYSNYINIEVIKIAVFLSRSNEMLSLTYNIRYKVFSYYSMSYLVELINKSVSLLFKTNISLKSIAVKMLDLLYSQLVESIWLISQLYLDK